MTRWQYTVTTREGPTDLVAQHMQQMDSNDWELLNGSTVCGIGGIAYTVWWRRKPGTRPHEEPRPHTTMEPARPAGMPGPT